MGQLQLCNNKKREKEGAGDAAFLKRVFYFVTGISSQVVDTHLGGFNAHEHTMSTKFYCI